MSIEECRAVAREEFDRAMADHIRVHEKESDIYLSTKDFNKEHTLHSQELVALKMQFANLRAWALVAATLAGAVSGLVIDAIKHLVK